MLVPCGDKLDILERSPEPVNASSKQTFPPKPEAVESLIKCDSKSRIKVITQAKGKTLRRNKGKKLL